MIDDDLEVSDSDNYDGYPIKRTVAVAVAVVVAVVVVIVVVIVVDCRLTINTSVDLSLKILLHPSECCDCVLIVY